MNETPKRLQPLKPVLRELYLKSGNQCSFPSCDEPIVNADGDYVAQLCHIEAAEPSGERFRENMSNEERRAFSNLLLMCYPHHVRTNDEDEYPVSGMQAIKAQHEVKFSDIPGAISSAFADKSKSTHFTRAKMLARFLSDTRLIDEERQESVDELNKYQDRLRKIPAATRTLLIVLAQRAEGESPVSGPTVPIAEIQAVTEQPFCVLRQHLAMLDKYGITSEGFPDEFGQDTVELRNLPSGWSFLTDLAEYCAEHSVPVQDVFVNLQFHLLD